MAITVLLCYAHEDERMVRQLKKHLILLERNGHIELWDDGDIDPGAEWRQEIDKHLTEAQIILLLISSSFLSSNYCYTVKMRQAIERHERKEARVIPVILRPVYWEEPPLDKLQALPDDQKPIPQWKPQDEGFRNVAVGVKKVIEQWNIHNLSGPKVERKEMIANLDRLIESIRMHLQPPARAMAIASTLQQTFQQLSIYIPNEVTLADLMVGWRTLSHASKEEEEPAIAQRRVTCGELANLASQLTTDEGNLAKAIKTWRVWRDAFQKSDDPRQTAMAKTFARELKELQEAAATR